MRITGFELYTVSSEYVTVDNIIWKRFMGRAIGMVELMMDANPHLATAHRRSPFLPVGVFVRVPIDPDLLLQKPQSLPQDSLWSDRQGYTLRGEAAPTSSLPVVSPIVEG